MSIYKGTQLIAGTRDNRANTDLSNLSATGEAHFVKSDLLRTIYPITHFWSLGTEGYMIYSNGYCEQWGEVTTTSAWFTVNLLKTFKDTSYNIIGSATNTNKNSYTATGTGSGCFASFMGLTTNSFQVYTADDSSYNNSVCRWKASGFLAEGEY